MDWEIINEYGKKKDTSCSRKWEQVKLFYTHGKKNQ
jgi:hypothetical protein